MLRYARIYAPDGRYITAEYVRDPRNPSEYRLKEPEGLGPVKAEVTVSSLSGRDGTQYVSSRVESRNVILPIKFEPDYANWGTAAELRRELYSLAPPKGRVTLRFVFDDGTEYFEIDGVVEDNDPDIFSKETTARISVICERPYFRRTVVTRWWEDPRQGFLIDFQDDIGTGFVFETTLSRDLGRLDIAKTGQDKMMSFRGLQGGDVLRISSVRGQKGVTIRRGSTTFNAIDQMVDKDVWFELNKYDRNYFWIENGAGALSRIRFAYAPLLVGL